MGNHPLRDSLEGSPAAKLEVEGHSVQPELLLLDPDPLHQRTLRLQSRYPVLASHSMGYESKGHGLSTYLYIPLRPLEKRDGRLRVLSCDGSVLF